MRTGTRNSQAFTLIELLVVISIIAILAGMAIPVINGLRPNVVDGAARQLLDDVSRARQLAIANRTTVYMVFVPSNFWNDASWPTDPASKTNGDQLLDKQMVGYNFVSLRSLGDQPGRPMPRYLSSWRTLPQGVHIAPEKFLPRSGAPIFRIYTNGPPQQLAMQIYGFNTTTNVPFPAEDVPPKSPAKPYVTLPFIAFNYLGQLTSGQNEYIPLAKGGVFFQRDTRAPPVFRDSPVGNVTNAYNVVSIDWLTGRAHLERQQVQ